MWGDAPITTHKVLVKPVCLGFIIEVYQLVIHVQEQCQTVYETAYDTQCHTGKTDIYYDDQSYFVQDRPSMSKPLNDSINTPM